MWWFIVGGVVLIIAVMMVLALCYVAGNEYPEVNPDDYPLNGGES